MDDIRQERPKGTYIKYAGGGGPRVFAGIMKYFSQILMRHEICLRIYDESQKIFLCTFLIF